MNELQRQGYSEDQIFRAEKLFEVLNLTPKRIKDKRSYVKGYLRYVTQFGFKTKEGVIATILNIMVSENYYYGGNLK